MSGIRARFVLILLLGVGLPIGLAGVWLVRSARRSAEALLLQQLDEQLANAAQAIGVRWMSLRGPLMDIAEDSQVLAGLGASNDVGTELAALVTEGASWDALDGVVDVLSFRDLQGHPRARVRRPPERSRGQAGPAGILPVQTVVFDRAGHSVGSMEAEVRLSALLASIYDWGAAVGGVPVILGPDGAPLVPMAMDPLLEGTAHFSWEGEGWLAARREVHDPRLTLVLAAPTASHTRPFTDVAKAGAVALGIVLVGALLLTLVLTGHIVTPIVRLTRSAEEVAAGRLDGRLPEPSGPDETKRLGRAFASMTVSLRTLIQRVSQQESAAAVGEFAASLAHEVRNPLTSVRIDLELAAERAGDPEAARSMIQRAIQQIERLDATVSGALRVARSGALPLAEVDLRIPLEGALRTAAASCSGNGARIEPWSPPSPALPVDGDAAALEQLFLNLLLNAVEASAGRDGSVRVDALQSAGGLQIRVRDEGRGMNEEERERALEPFFTTRAEGTGLGLTIVDRIVRAHGATLEIDSREGEGTTVSVTFPPAGRSVSSPGSNIP